MVRAIAAASGSPISAMIELVDRCNEACVHCYQVHGRKDREMSTEEVFRLLDELAEMGVLFLTLSGGEPTLRRDFLDIVAYARKKRFAVKIYSNGLRIDEAMAERLAELAVQEVQLSLYSHRPEPHDAVTRVPGSWEKTVAAARRLLARGIKVLFKTPLMRGVNEDAIEEYAAFARSLGADFGIDSEVTPREDGDRTPTILKIRDEHVVALEQSVLAAARPASTRRAPAASGASSPTARSRAEVLGERPCRVASGMVHVEADGVIQPCTMLSEHLGHVSEGVRAAWQGDRSELLRGLTNGDLHGCRDCDLLPWCHRCYATAMHEAGDALGPYATACRRAMQRWKARFGPLEVLPPEEPGRDPEVGPYRFEGEGRLRPIPDVVTDRDRELARRLGWRRRAPAPAPRLVPAELLVRGRKRAAAHADEVAETTVSAAAAVGEGR